MALDMVLDIHQTCISFQTTHELFIRKDPLYMPNGMKEGKLEGKHSFLGSLQGHFEYLEVDGIDQHENSELVDGVRGNDVSDAPFSLVSYPLVDGQSGLLCLLLWRTGNKAALTCAI